VVFKNIDDLKKFVEVRAEITGYDLSSSDSDEEMDFFEKRLSEASIIQPKEFSMYQD